MAVPDSDGPIRTRKPPKRVLSAHFGLADSADQIQLDVKVSDKQGIKMYGFAYAGSPVVMANNEGTFFATAGVQGLLEWVMAGSALGTMKVEVLRDGDVIQSREKSTIPDSPSPTGNPFDVRGYDALQIKVT